MNLNRKTARRPATYLVILFIVLSVALIALATRPSQPEAGAHLADVNLDSLTILHVGGGDLATQLVDRLEAAGGQVVRSPDVPEAADLSPDVVVVFGGEWFEQRAYDTELHSFLSVASSRGAGLIMAGASTSRFFEALDKARVYIMAVDERTGEARNPAHYNPPVVGYRIKEVGSHTGPSLLFSSGSSPDVLAESLVEWLPHTTAAVLSEPYLQYTGEYIFSPLLDSDPHGRLDVIATVYGLESDDVSDYDWYFYQVTVRSVPGMVAYDSAWRSDHTWAHHQVHNAGTDRWMDNYGPGTSGGTDTVYVFLTPLGTPIGSVWYDPLNWSYSIDDVVVLARRDYSKHRAYWQHDIDRAATVARDTYVSMPGFVVRTRQGYPSFVDAWYQVQFVRRPLWWSTQTTGPSPTLMLDAFRVGD